MVLLGPPAFLLLLLVLALLADCFPFPAPFLLLEAAWRLLDSPRAWVSLARFWAGNMNKGNKNAIKKEKKGRGG